MTTNLALLSIIFCQLAPAAASALTPVEVNADVALAREAFERVHPGYERYADAAELGEAWQGIADDARESNGMPVARLYLRVQEVLAQIRCDHTKAELPAAMAKARRSAPVYLPLRFTIVERRAIVVAVPQNSPIGIHEEILAIDGQSVASLIARFAPLIPVDGFTDHARVGKLAHSSEFSGGGIEHFMALEGVEPSAELRIAAAGGRQRELSVARIGLDAQRAIGSGVDGAANFSHALSLEMRKDGAAVLRVDSFVNYREPVDPDEIYAPVFKAINDAKVRHLVVDLRNNGGGSDDARDRLFAHLLSDSAFIVREVRVKTLDLSGIRDHLSTWETRALNPRRWWFSRLGDDSYRLRGWLFGIGGKIRPARQAFSGEVSILSSTSNSSGSTMLIGALQALGRARVVGEATGGSVAGPTAGVLFFLKLPNSEIVLRLPSQRIFTGYGDKSAGQGVIPDIPIKPSVDDLRAGRDLALERALEKTGS